MEPKTQSDSQTQDIKKLVTLSILILILLSILAQGCSEKCATETITYYEAIYSPISEVIKTAQYESPRAIQNAGKLYYKDGYLFINEIDEGIHVIDNRDRSNPISTGFIALPGNKDLAAKGDYLYADNYTDLVILNIADKNQITEVNRVENVFESYYYYSEDIGMLIDYMEVVEEVEVDCDGDDQYYYNEYITSGEIQFAAESGGGGNTGIGGSLARFTITNEYLYTINEYQLQLFNISDAETPVEGNSVDLGWGIETIFPYGDKLFFGARSGMHIYDNSNPANPTFVSTYEHINTCDPVVVQDSLAYVTLRSGTTCETFTNQLEVINISDPYTPEVVAIHEMLNPHGLGIKGNCLFIAEGEFGLKVFEASDPLTINNNLKAHHKDVHALDVIPLDDVLFMIGNDGLHQYDYNCGNTFTHLSSITF